MFINQEDLVLLKDSLSYSQGNLLYKIGEDPGGLFKGLFLELDTDEKNKDLELNFKTRSSGKLKDNSCENFQILLKS